MDDGVTKEGTQCYPPVRLPSSSPSSSSSIRPHRCDICQRSFREVATLRKHEQLHRADRPYVCNTCGKSFLWSSNLKVHERVHTGERPYKCKICHRCFTQSNDLRRHERNVHMRGKLYGYRQGMGRGVGAGGGGNVNNLAAYQAFAMQQRAMLQQALTYENYLHTAAVTQPQVFAQPPGLTSNAKETPMACVPPNSSNGVGRGMRVEESGWGEGEVRTSPVKLEQMTPPATPGDGLVEKRKMVVSQGQMPVSQGGDLLRCSPVNSRYLPTSTCHPTPPSAPPRSPPPPPLLLAPGQGPYMAKPPSHLHSPHQTSPSSVPRAPLPSFSSFRHHPHHHPAHSSSEAEECHSYTPSPLPSTTRNQSKEMREEREGYPCDSVMDLSIHKTPEFRTASDHKPFTEDPDDDSSLAPPQTPSSESECEGKRDVTTTTSGSPDKGVHHCQHCNIFFHDYTMYHLHESLHMPYDDYPFCCPSCGKHCQDRIEFMFHTVWHVKYPHTIPNYEPFKDHLIA